MAKPNSIDSQFITIARSIKAKTGWRSRGSRIRFSLTNSDRHKSRFLLVLLLCLSITACNESVDSSIPVSEETPLTLDASKVSVNRVVALTSLSADLIHRMDASKLVGIPGSRLLQNNKDFESLPKVSQGRTQPNLENIVSLKPDLVIGAQGFHDAILKKLDELGIKTLASEVNSWESFESLTNRLATVLEADSATVLNQFKDCKAEVGDKQPSTLMIVSHQPILAPNKNSWAGEMLESFKLKNSVAALQSDGPMAGFVTLSEEKVLETDPDVILVVNADPSTMKALKQKSFWSQLQATQNNQIYEADYYGMVNPGSVDAIEKACTQLKTLSQS